jgi:60 kDa SS-A/Ro ribonucleoprotein
LRRVPSPTARYPRSAPEFVQQSPSGHGLPPGTPVSAHDGRTVFAVGPWEQALRFLILGSAGGSFYASERDLTKENTDVLKQCILEDGERFVQLVVDVSTNNRAPSNDPALFALALAMSVPPPHSETRKLAYQAVPKVARIGTHLFHLVAYIDAMRSWGVGPRMAISAWYNDRRPLSLVEQLTKYQSRDGWSHRDVIRIVHPKGPTPTHTHLYKVAVGKVTSDADVPAWVRAGWDGPRKGARKAGVYQPNANRPEDVQAWRKMGAVRSMSAGMPIAAAVALITEYRLPREVVPTELLQKPEVWEALLPHMGLTAMIRSLAKLTEVGVLFTLGGPLRHVCEQITDQDRLFKERVHPMALLIALKTYAQGKGERGKLTWTPIQDVIDALDAAFYLAFGAVKPAGTKHLLAVDVSGSMDGGGYKGSYEYSGFPDVRPGLSPRMCAAAMALVTANIEPWFGIVGFSHELISLPISPNTRLDQAVKVMQAVPMGATDCSLPMLWAAKHKIPVETFVVYTDSETNVHRVPPVRALQMYREVMGIPARLIVCGMVSNGFTIADPTDAGMLDVVGFDAAAPVLMSTFARGEL